MRHLALAAVLVLVIGCGKDKAAAPPAPQPPRPFALSGLKVQIDLPGNAKLDSDQAASADASWPTVHMGVRSGASGLAAKSLESAVAEAGSAKISKQDKTADGWDLRYEETLGGEPLYNVVIHRTVAGVELECHGSSNVAASADAIATACATLRPQ